MILLIGFLSSLLCNSSKIRANDVVIEMKALGGKENSFNARETLLKEIFKRNNLLRILLMFLDKKLPTICGSFVNQKILQIYKEGMEDVHREKPIYSLEEILMLSATHCKFNAAFREEIVKNKPNHSVLQHLHHYRLDRQAHLQAISNFDRFQNFELPLEYAKLAARAVKIQHEAKNKFKIKEEEYFSLRETLMAKNKKFIVHFLVLLASIAVYNALIFISFDSMWGMFFRCLSMIFFWAGLFVVIPTKSFDKADKGLCMVGIFLFGFGSTVLLLLGSVLHPSDIVIQILTMLYLGICHFLPIVNFTVPAVVDYAHSLYHQLQNLKNLRAEKKKLNQKNQKLQKYLFLE